MAYICVVSFHSSFLDRLARLHTRTEQNTHSMGEKPIDSMSPEQRKLYIDSVLNVKVSVLWRRERWLETSLMIRKTLQPPTILIKHISPALTFVVIYHEKNTARRGVA